MIRGASILFAVLASTSAFAQVDCNQGLEPIDRQADSRMTAVDFIKEVAANEISFAKAFGQFNYTLEVNLKTLQDNTVDGEFHEVTTIAYDAGSGARRVTRLGDTVNTLKRVSLPNRDVDALRDAFTITPDVLADRDIVYSGRQQIEDFRAAVFDILPRNPQSPARGFSGRTWIRMRDNAIVRICGRVAGGPFGPMRYLVQRTKVIDKYWFPSKIVADENVRADDNDVHVQVAVTYSGYTPR
jgi:hypothetical protein